MRGVTFHLTCVKYKHLISIFQFVLVIKAPCDLHNSLQNMLRMRSIDGVYEKIDFVYANAPYSRTYALIFAVNCAVN